MVVGFHQLEKKKKEFKELLKAGMVAQDEDNYKEAIESSFKVFAPPRN